MSGTAWAGDGIALPFHARAVAFGPDGTHLACGGWHAVKVWDLVTGQTLTYPGLQETASGVAWSPDGKWVGSVNGRDTARLWNAATGRQAAVLRHHFDDNLFCVRALAFSSDGRVATGGDDHTIRIWNPASRRDLGIGRGHAASVTHLAFSPDGRWLVSAGKDFTVKVWDAATLKECRSRRFFGTIHALAVSADGLHVATAAGKELLVWNIHSGRDVRGVFGQAGAVRALAFSPDGKRLASGGDDKVVRLWELATRKESLTLAGHVNLISSVAYSPTGTHIAAASDDMTVRVWDLRSEVP